jgi:hypothetical protein
MNKLLNSPIIIAITAFIVITLFEGCVTSLEPLAISGDFADLNYLKSHPPQKTNSPLLERQNRKRAKEYAAQGVLKMNSKDTNELKLARRLFYASLSYEDTSPEVWGYLGDVSVQENQLNKTNISNDKLMSAIYYYDRAIELDSMNNSFYYERANCYFLIGDTAYLSDYRKSCNLGNSKACIAIK